ncbi:unnamed protein product [Rhizophagus irregularis]|nr:unnamed protein product [Rhizophagus irregularis]
MLNKNDKNETKWKKFDKKINLGEITGKRKNDIIKLIKSYEEIFEYDEEKLGKVDTVKHKIEIKEGQESIAQKKYKETEEKGKFIKKEVEQLLKMGKIRKSWSPWASPVTLAGKKMGNYRFCIDYRKLNNVTKSDAYPLPRIDELLEKYRTARWFTSLDLAAGYHQVEMTEEDREKTAFICSQGLYEYNVMPFGLKNAPGTFQRLMDEILKEYIGEFVIVYLDDIMIYSKNFEEHMEHIDKVLNKLRENNLIVKLKKCKFGERNIEFLGHIVGRDGLKQHSGHAYITMPIILLIINIFQTSINNISKFSYPILIKLYSLDSPHRDESNGGIFINFGSLDAKIFTILYFYYELSHYIKSADLAWLHRYTFGRAIKIDKFKFFNDIE